MLFGIDRLLDEAPLRAPLQGKRVALLAHYAHDQRIPLIARGSGTGLAGGCLGTGIVIDFSRDAALPSASTTQSRVIAAFPSPSVWPK